MSESTYRPSPKVFNRDFVMVLIGQIISIFGNSCLRFAIPLYLLQQTGSSSVYGTVSALSIIPMILLSPVGGLLADRVNKKKIMFILDFITSGLITLYFLLLGHLDLTLLVAAVMLLLSSIQSLYTPSVNAAVPLLETQENIVKANSAVNSVTSLAGIVAPTVGGLIYSFLGMRPLLIISILLFFSEAVMEMFIRMPDVASGEESSGFVGFFKDIGATFVYVVREQKAILHMLLVCLLMNMISSALYSTAIPVIITQKLGFSQELSSTLYGYFGSACSIGSLLGAVLAGTLAKKIRLRHEYLLLLITEIPVLLTGLALLCFSSSMSIYLVLIISNFVGMIACGIFNIQLISGIQSIAPKEQLGRIMGLITMVAMAGSPIGQAVYGILLDHIAPAYILLGAYGLCLGIVVMTKKTSLEIEQALEARQS